MCVTCQQIHPHIFTQGFVCVNKACKAFWTLNGSKLTDDDALDYDPVFIAERTEWNAQIRSPFIAPPRAQKQLEASSSFNGQLLPVRKEARPHRRRWDGVHSVH